MGFELLAAGALGGLVGGYFVVRRWFAQRRSRLAPRASKGSGSSSENAAHAELRVGDVVGIGVREYWLTTGYSLHEAGHALALVFSAEESRLVVTLGAEAALYLGYEVSVTLPSELPARLEHLDHTFSLRARFPVEVSTHAQASPRAASAQWGRYDDGGEQTLWVLRTSDRAEAMLCRRVPERDIFRWGSAEDT